MQTLIFAGMENRRYGRTFIREWRKKRGLSLRRLSDRLESEPGGDPLLSHASLGRIENGQQPYTQDSLEAIARALNVSVSMLLEMDPDKEGEVVDLMRHLEGDKRAQALEYIRYLAQK